MKKKYFIIAGESSGDEHGSLLMKEMLKLNSNICFDGIGGKKMDSLGLSSLYSLDKMAVMGFIEVLKNYSFFKTVEKKVIKKISKQKYDGIILIDYPGFNLRISKKIKSLSSKLPIYYYISPQIWAWKEDRINTIKKYIDKMIVIFDFEERWYKERGVQASFVGHPFVDLYKSADKTALCSNLNLNIKNKHLTLFPGSRKQEIKNHLPIMLNALKNDFFKSFKVLLGVAPEIKKDLLLNYDLSNIQIVDSYPEEALAVADFAWVGSGTSTLQAVLFNTPFVLVYKTSFLSWMLMKKLVRVPYAGIPNIIYNEELIPELLQKNFTSKNLISETKRFFNDSIYRASLFDGYKTIQLKLGSPGASARAAQTILGL